MPRGRDGSFEPELIKKGQTRIDGMDNKIIRLYAAGLSNRDKSKGAVGWLPPLSITQQEALAYAELTNL